MFIFSNFVKKIEKESMMSLLNRITQFTFLTLTLSSAFAFAAETESAKNNVAISNAWVRATNPGQAVGAAYMTLTAKQDVTLISVESDVTSSVEIHSMSMANGVMKMRMLNNLPLTANEPYILAPGGFHIMLFDLKKPLNAGEKVNLTFNFKSSTASFKQTIVVPVKSIEDAATKESANHEHQH